MNEKDPIERALHGLEPFTLAKFEGKPSGTILVDGEEVAHTLQCPHCNSHFISFRGSGMKRGYCMECKAVTCGEKVCMRCIPYEKRMELYEAGKIKHLMDEPR